jgi:CheY-like chemotaxis protein
MPLRLLIVDDEQEICQMLSRHFRLLGMNISTAANGKDALQHLASNSVDIVLSDIRMPEMDGVELCRQLRKDYPLVRIILMTGQVNLESALACLRQGVDDCLFKPFEDLSLLEDAVDRSKGILDRWKMVLNKLAATNQIESNQTKSGV